MEEISVLSSDESVHISTTSRPQVSPTPSWDKAEELTPAISTLVDTVVSTEKVSQITKYVPMQGFPSSDF